MGYDKKTKTEHSGAKNGGGYWGTREEAKQNSKKIRRSNEQKEISKEIERYEQENIKPTD